jgi:hypothetical protein
LSSEKQPTSTPESDIQSGELPKRGFKPLDLSMAYRALIESFVRSDEVPLPDEQARQSEPEVYDNS